MEVVSRSNAALPSISHFDPTKPKREEEEQSHRSGSSMPSPSLYRFGGHNAHYSHNQNQQSHRSGLVSPPESRRTSSEENVAPPPARQSLPSISEALGRDSALNYGGPPPPPPPPTAATTSSFFPHTAPTATAPPPKRELTYPPPLSAQHNRPAQPPTPSSARSNSLPGSSMFPSQDTKPHMPPSRNGNSPSLSHNHAGSQYSPNQHSPTQYGPAPQSAPPNGSFTFTSSYQSQHGYPATASGSYPVQASASLNGPLPYPEAPGGYGQDNSKRELRPLKAYGDSVKRRLDQFDLEASLYELAGSGGRLREYAEACARQVHEAQNAGDVAAKLVSMNDLDKLSSDIATIQRAFSKLRDVVIASHTEVQNERQRDLQRQYPGGIPPEHSAYANESSLNNGALQPDLKKRRGRAAPPGRCHSCNRAETPEWRRGPDGARTLCNACGLHYAKLTRKMGVAKNNISNSSLRPKGA